MVKFTEFVTLAFVRVTVELPRFIARTDVDVEFKALADSANVEVLNVPASMLTLPVVVRAVPRVHAPPIPEHVILEANDIPFVLIVLPVVVDANVMAPVYVLTIPVAGRVMLPYMLRALLPARVTVVEVPDGPAIIRL